MELLNNMLTALAGAVAVAQGGFNFYQWIVGYLKRSQSTSRTREMLRLLHDLGQASDHDVRELVKNWAKRAKVTDQQREELTNLLINLTHGARFHSTHGTPTSSFLRSTRLLDQLLSNLQPRRRTGEPPGPGWDDWYLEKFLGMGTFGEVWLGRCKLFPLPQAFKFFTQEGAKEWLLREQQTLSDLTTRLGDHPNIIEFRNVVVRGQPWPFLVLEYVGGGSMEDWILSHAEDRVPLYKNDIIAGIVRGLSRAHSAGIYHRDLKPEHPAD